MLRKTKRRSTKKKVKIPAMGKGGFFVTTKKLVKAVKKAVKKKEEPMNQQQFEQAYARNKAFNERFDKMGRPLLSLIKSIYKLK